MSLDHSSNGDDDNDGGGICLFPELEEKGAHSHQRHHGASLATSTNAGQDTENANQAFSWSPGWISRNMPEDWSTLLRAEFGLRYIRYLEDEVAKEYQTTITNRRCYPDPVNIFAALRLCPVNQVKVVILGQDPYHGPGQAQGLAFSVPRGVPLPPSLENIFREVALSLRQSRDEYVKTRKRNGDLTKWAEQGVLLLNTTLTVRHKAANSHSHLPWSRLTKAMVREISKHHQGIVFMLWGKNAQGLRAAICSSERHHILTASHPSPLSAARGFFGCNHFEIVNQILQSHNLRSIDWET